MINIFEKNYGNEPVNEPLPDSYKLEGQSRQDEEVPEHFEVELGEDFARGVVEVIINKLKSR